MRVTKQRQKKQSSLWWLLILLVCFTVEVLWNNFHVSVAALQRCVCTLVCVCVSYLELMVFCQQSVILLSKAFGLFRHGLHFSFRLVHSCGYKHIRPQCFCLGENKKYSAAAGVLFIFRSQRTVPRFWKIWLQVTCERCGNPSPSSAALTWFFNFSTSNFSCWLLIVMAFSSSRRAWSSQ